MPIFVSVIIAGFFLLLAFAAGIILGAHYGEAKGRLMQQYEDINPGVFIDEEFENVTPKYIGNVVPFSARKSYPL